MKAYLRFGIKITLVLMQVFFVSFYSFSINRTWIGAGNGGSGTNFNASANWSPSGVPSSGDNLTITTASSATITLSASVTVNNLSVVASSSSGLNILQLSIGANTLTINGTAYFDCVRFSSSFPFADYDMTVIQVNSGTIIINGNATVHGTGNGYNTFLRANTSSPGDFIFRGDVTFGAWARTEPGVEPDMIFDKAGAQTLTFNMSVDHVKGESLIFGSVNSPTVTVTGTSSAQQTFQSYDGNITINANTLVNANYATLDRFTGTGTFTMNSGSVLNINYTNNFPAGFSPVNLNATSTVEYLGVSASQSVDGLTYGHLISGGSGTKTAAANMTIQGNFLIRSGSTYSGSSRTHNLRGNFTNNGTFTASTSTFVMDGSIAQYIQGTSQTTFYRLTVNNSSGAANGVYLNSTNATPITSVSNLLTLTSGALKLNSQKLIITNAATTAVARTSGYVVSETNLAVNPSIIQWNIGTTAGAHIFPFGTTAGDYIPVTFNNSGASGNVSIATRRTTNSCVSPAAVAGYCNQPWAGLSNVAAVGNMYDPTIVGDGSVAAVIDRWWDITSSLVSPIPAVTLTLNYVGSENTMTPATDILGFQHWNGSVWNSGTGSGTYVSSGTAGLQTAGPHAVTAGGFTYFSPYVLSRITAPLPVELLSFTAECKGDKVIAEWETASEQNSDYFTLEKSTDGTVFYPVINIPAAGNSSVIKKYSAEDTDPFSASAYYRLSETDLNGVIQAFDVIAIKGCGSDNITAFSSGDNVMVMIDSKADDNYHIMLYDAQGKIILDLNEFFAAGKNQATFSVDANSGIYYLKVFNDKNIRVQKLAIQK